MSERFKPHTLEGDERPEQTEVLSIGVRERADSEMTPEQKTIREHIDAIDEKTLREIFEEEMQRCGIDVSETNFIPLKQIIIDDSRELEDGEMGLHEIVIRGQKHDVYISPAKESFKTFPDVLWTVIHEELHSVTTRGSITESTILKNTVEGASGVEKFNSTYNTLTDKAQNKERHFSMLNEGVTELITERIITEYSRRTGIGEPVDVIHKNYGKETTYADAWQKVQTYIAFIATLSDSTYDTTEDAVLRAYFRNGSLIPPELSALLDERSPGLSQEFEELLDTGFSKIEILNFFLALLERKIFTPEEHEKFLLQWDKISERIIESREHVERSGGGA